MKLVWLSHFVPFPPRGGAHQRSFNLLRHISGGYETVLVALNMRGETKQRTADYAGELKKYCVEVEIWEPPYRWRGVRWWAQLALSPLYRYHYGACALWSPELDARWRRVLQKHPGALLHFESIDLAGYLPAAVGFKKVLNHQNCESAMLARRAANEPNPLKRAYLGHQARKLQRLEEELCHQFDVNLAVSELDAKTLQARDPQAHFHIVENGTDTDYFHPSASAPEPNTLVFAGSLNWYPNLSGLRYFNEKVWPLIKGACPEAWLYITGMKPVGWLVSLAGRDPSITLVPDPEDIRPIVARAAVFVCPVLDGGGTKLKILDALAMGKAVVSSSIGAEGLDVIPGEHLLVADTPERFSENVLRLLDDDGLRARLETAGRSLAEHRYGWEVIGRHLETGYQCALGLKEPCRLLRKPGPGVGAAR